MKNKIWISQAADILGVSVATLRRWIIKGVITPTIHPVNGYQLFDKETLEELKNKINA